MGSEQSTSAIKNQQQFQSFMIQYSKEREYTHPQFGHIKLYDHNMSNETIMLKKFQTKSSQELDQLAIHLKRRKQYDHQNLFKLIAVRTNQDSQFCSDASQVIVIGDCYIDTLQDEINIRQGKQQFYPESHIWILIEQIVDPLSYLEDKKQVHGDLRPQNINLDQRGTIKLAEYNMLPGSYPGFQKILFCKDKVYLSPLLLQAYSQENFRPIHNQQKSDVYTFGLTLLHVILLEDSFDCFDYSSGSVLSGVIEEKLQRARKLGYSQVLVNFVREVLKIEEEDRPNWNELKEVIDQFREQINNLQPFYNKGAQENVMVISKSVLQRPNIQTSVIPIQMSTPIIPRSPQRVLAFSPQRRVNMPIYASPSTDALDSLKQSVKQPIMKSSVKSSVENQKQ